MLATRLLLGRCLRWTAVAAVAVALLVLLVDWVELGARPAPSGEPAVTNALRMALLLLPGHLVRAAPLVVGLGAALAVAGLQRSGEWQALAATGLGLRRRLLPFALVGALAGLCVLAAEQLLVPPATSAHARAVASTLGGPLALPEGTWIERGGTLFQLGWRPDEGPGPVLAIERREGQLAGSWRTDALHWEEGTGWRATGEVDRRSWPDQADGALDPPWSRLPSPAELQGLLGPDLLAARGWAALGRDARPAARAERQARWSRALACPLAGLAAAAVPAILGAGSLVIVLAALPILAWELLGAVLQAASAGGTLPPVSNALGRLGLALLLAGLLLRRLRRA